MIVGTTGTLLGPRPAQYDAFKRFVRRLPIKRFVHGGARGWDTLAHHAVRSHFPDIPIEIRPGRDPGTTVTMPLGRCDIYPALAKLERNMVIVGRIHGLIAVPKQDIEERRSGTWATVRYARKLGCPVYVVLSDGRIVRDREPEL